jgi:hypothetical protein
MRKEEWYHVGIPVQKLITEMKSEKPKSRLKTLPD